MPYHYYMSRGYEDRLYPPATPCTQMLTSSTYETYELDKRKYVKYRRAVMDAVIQAIFRAPDAGRYDKNKM